LKQNGRANTATPMMLFARLKTNGQLDAKCRDMTPSISVTVDINDSS